MAGTINLSLSQQFSNAGRPLSGGRLYFYQAATTTPQNAFKDVALTLVHPNPIILDSSGRIPEFWLADGNIKFVLTDKSGVVQISSISTQVLGPSSGSGGGSTVDPTTIFQTGDVIWLDVQGTRTGWVRDNARSIGSSTSGASERANADCSLLYVFLWNNFTDAVCAVNGGRGISAAADWAANKFIGLPDKRGYVPGGLDDMGNTAAGLYANVPVQNGDAITGGGRLGENFHTLVNGELPIITPTGTVSRPAITATVNGPNLAGSGQNGTSAGGTLAAINPGGFSVTASLNNDPVFSGNSFGNNNPHNTVQRTVLGTYYRKL